jgi:hypothetical protein
MKLSELVSFYNHLNGFETEPMHVANHHHLAPIVHAIINDKLQFSDLSEQLTSNYHQIQDSIRQFENTLDQVKESVQAIIETSESSYYANSYELYESQRHDKNETILSRTIQLTPEHQEFLTTRIRSYADWHYPGMIIRPGCDLPWSNQVVALDPLYLVDQHHDLFDPFVSGFSSEYQRRLRQYIVDEYADPIAPFLGQLPDGQFGFILAYNFFNFKPLSIISKYLEEAYIKLRPGGTLAMTFNNCDQSGGVKLAERSYAAYTPGRRIRDIATQLDFRVTMFYEINSAITWLELKKPGELSSLRGGQALAKIVARA